MAIHKYSKHKVKNRALARISCACGWFWRNEALRGKSDEDLNLELDLEFKTHVDNMMELDEQREGK